MKINILTQEEMDRIPLGMPLESICPVEGYGNHSCRDCVTGIQCPIYGYTGDANRMNTCSYYWPPNMINKASSSWYWKELNQIAVERKGR